MRLTVLLILIVAVVPDRPAPAPRAKPKSMHERLLGHWRLVKYTRDGNDEDRYTGTTMVFGRTEVEIHERGKRSPEEDMTYRLVAETNPAQIDLVPKRDDPKTYQGIVKIEGDSLTLCLPQNGEGKRPNEFASPANSGMTLMQFRRVVLTLP
jgi:uncharacterized protein (TIGR03067 family)